MAQEDKKLGATLNEAEAACAISKDLTFTYRLASV